MMRPYVRDLYGFRMDNAEPGAVELSLPWRRELGHADGMFQGTVTCAIAECAASWSGLTLIPADWSGVTLEQSVRFVGAARGETLLAIGRVISAGRSIGFCAADIYAEHRGERTLVATMQQTNRYAPPRGA